MEANTMLLGFAFLAILLLIFLVARVKMSAFLALIVVSVLLGLASGMEPASVLRSFEQGVGSVLASIAVVIALGTILGKILAESGAAEGIALRIASFFGPRHLAWAFLAIGFIAGLPVFFAVGLVLLVPIFEAVCREHRLPRLKAGLPMLAGLSAAHGLVPPHPGPLAAIGILGANLGKTLLYSVPIALFAAILAGPLFVRLLRARILEAPAPALAPDGARKEPPSFALSLAVILVPLLLMGAGSFVSIYAPFDSAIRKITAVLCHPVSALLLGILFARVTIGRRFGPEEILRFGEEALAPVGSILLVIAAGSGFSRVLIDSGVGQEVSNLAKVWNLPVLPMGFVLASLIRVATGSATVAITTCAGLVKPLAEGTPGTNLELLVLAMGAGSLILSHVNDGGFWLVKGYLNIDVPRALKTWTVLETILALAAFGAILVLNATLSAT